MPIGMVGRLPLFDDGLWGSQAPFPAATCLTETLESRPRPSPTPTRGFIARVMQRGASFDPVHFICIPSKYFVSAETGGLPCAPHAGENHA